MQCGGHVRADEGLGADVQQAFRTVQSIVSTAAFRSASASPAKSRSGACGP